MNPVIYGKLTVGDRVAFGRELFDDRGRWIGTVHGPHNGNGKFPSDDECDAMAKLFASAGPLLEAARNLFDAPYWSRSQAMGELNRIVSDIENGKPLRTAPEKGVEQIAVDAYIDDLARQLDCSSGDVVMAMAFFVNSYFKGNDAVAFLRPTIEGLRSKRNNAAGGCTRTSDTPAQSAGVAT